jgi:hypothetical protein
MACRPALPIVHFMLYIQWLASLLRGFPAWAPISAAFGPIIFP